MGGQIVGQGIQHWHDSGSRNYCIDIAEERVQGFAMLELLLHCGQCGMLTQTEQGRH
jgi:hypothetical protein